MSLLIAVPATFGLIVLTAGWLCKHTALGNYVDRLLAGPPADEDLVYELADLYGLADFPEATSNGLLGHRRSNRSRHRHLRRAAAHRTVRVVHLASTPPSPSASGVHPSPTRTAAVPPSPPRTEEPR